MVKTDPMEISRSESLSLSSSSSSSFSSEAVKKEVPPTSTLAPATSPLPPRSPNRSPNKTAATNNQKSETESESETIVFFASHEAKINQEKKHANGDGDRSNSQQQRNELNTIQIGQNNHDKKRPPQHTTRGNLDDNNLFSNDAKIYEKEEFQYESPQRKLNPPRHDRRVSWGGKLIQIPDYPMPDFDPGNDNKDNESQKGSRTKAASEIVSAIEATMKKDGIDNSDIINTKYQDESSASAIQMDDLAKMHPIESEAALEILKAIESQDRDHQDDDLQDQEQIEVLATLFDSSATRILDNVPEGAEGMFQRPGRKMSHASSVADNSTNANMSETMVDSSNFRNDSMPRSERPRIDSVTQYSIASTLGEATRNTRISNPDHQRTNTMTSFPTIATTARSPQRQAKQNYDYRPQHRRQQTMEERLFSLNQALDAVDTSASTEHNRLNRQDLDPKKERRENPSKYHHGPSASLDLFNQNLARLFQDNDGNPANLQGNWDEKEIVPLTRSSFRGSINPPTNNINPTIDTGNSDDKKQNNLVSDDMSLDGISNSSEHMTPKNTNLSSGDLQGENFAGGGNSTSTSTLKRYGQHGIPPRLDDDIEAGRFHPTTSNVTSSSVSNGKKKRSNFHRFMNKIGLVHDMEFFLKSRRPSMFRYLKNLFLFILIAIVFSAIMFYALGNPPIIYRGELDVSSPNQTCRYMSDTESVPVSAAKGASYSWWILYLLVRLPITLTMARFLEIFWIQFILLECRWVASCMGSTFTLLIVQSKGWPAILFFWSICNLFMLYGTSPFVHHWGYWQDSIELFNECNASGTIIESDTNLKVQLIALVVSIVVAVKRLLIGFYQGRKTFLHYAAELSTLMAKILLISEVSNLLVDFELEEQDDELSDSDESNMDNRLSHLYKGSRSRFSGIDNATEMLKRSIDDEEGVEVGSEAGSSLKTNSTLKTNLTMNKLLISDQGKEFMTGLLSQPQKRRIERLLGSWEEPEKEKILTDNISIGAILQFRRSLSKLDAAYPFSYAFGRADTRDNCIQSSQNLYLRLLEKTSDKVLHFNILGLVALQPDGSLDQEKLKLLIKVFRPDRDGLLSLIDFVKSTDIVYKEMKLLRASVRSAQKIDKSFERIFNIMFYFVITCVVLNVLGYDPIAVFLSLSSVVLAFSFMISQASSKYVEGLLFILYRRPYDIGDCIVIQPIDEPTSWDGSTEWIVRDINLFTTTVVFAYTNEIATLSNGSIANSRVMNGARSLPAIIYVTLRFGVDTGFEKLEIFREAVSQYVNKRPREWAKLKRITSVNVEADKGFVEYLVVLQHVNNWQHLASVNTSRSQAKFFCHELSKQLGMRYKSPPLPVDLSMDKLSDSAGPEEGNIDSKIMPAIAKLSAESDQIRNLIRDRRM